MTPPRSFPAFAIVFAVVFAVVYVIAVEENYALFTYHPAIGEFGAGVQQPKDGPAMYWYGWLATSGHRRVALRACSRACCPSPWRGGSGPAGRGSCRWR